VTLALRHSWGPDLDAATLYGLLRLRVDVFVVEQACPYPELDGRDLQPTTQHFWLDDTGGQDSGGQVISTLRLMLEGGSAERSFRIGRVCTRASDRGRGHSTRLMHAALAEVGEHPCRLSAQSYLADMYARHGFVVDGPEFIEDGIAHVPMARLALTGGTRR
jgi:ElaA protein